MGFASNILDKDRPPSWADISFTSTSFGINPNFSSFNFYLFCVDVELQLERLAKIGHNLYQLIA